MKFVILFKDNIDADPDIRTIHMPAHLSFLAKHSDQIEAAGPLAETKGAPAGGIWIVEACSEAEVQDLIHADPFWPTGLRDSYRILRWKQVFAGGHGRISPQSP